MIIIRAKTNIPNIRIFVRNNQTNIRLSFETIRMIFSSPFLEVSDPEEVVKFSIIKLTIVG